MFNCTPRYIGRDGQPLTSQRSLWDGFASYKPAYQTTKAKRRSNGGKAKRRPKVRASEPDK